MKTRIYLLLMAIGLLSFTACQDDEGLSLDQVPEGLRNDFTERHPGTTNIEWEQEGDIWEGEFVENGVEVSIIYDLSFNWIRTERDIPLADLPKNIMVYLTSNYPGGVVDEAATFDSAEDGNGYVAEVVFEGKEFEVFFDLDGNFIREVEEIEDGD